MPMRVDENESVSGGRASRAIELWRKPRRAAASRQKSTFRKVPGTTMSANAERACCSVETSLAYSVACSAVDLVFAASVVLLQS